MRDGTPRSRDSGRSMCGLITTSNYHGYVSFRQVQNVPVSFEVLDVMTGTMALTDSSAVKTPSISQEISILAISLNFRQLSAIGDV